MNRVAGISTASTEPHRALLAPGTSAGGRGAEPPSFSRALTQLAPGAMGEVARGIARLAERAEPSGGVDALWRAQADAQAMQVEMLALQQSIQDENRRYTTLTNVMKAQHDTQKAAIANIRV